LAKTHENDGLVIVAVNAWNDSKKDIQGFVKRGKLKQLMLLKGAAVARMYKVKSVPTTLWIDHTGKIVDTEIGFESAEDLKARTERLLALSK
jgi:thioredoxin-related protein